MHFDWSTLALQTINFAILVWLLDRFLYRPVLRVMNARRAEIEAHYAAARDAESKANEALASIVAQRTAIAGERAAALEGAAAESEKAASARREESEREAAALLDGARRTLAAERDQAMADLRQIALDLAGAMTRRVLAAAPSRLREQVGLERIEERLRALSKVDVDGLIGTAADRQPVRIVTAETLSAELVEHWRETLHRLAGSEIEIVFETDPELIAGAEVHFPNAVLSDTWKSALAAIRVESEADGDA